MAIEEALDRLEAKLEEQLVRTKALEMTLDQVLVEARRTNGRVSIGEAKWVAHDLAEARADGRIAGRSEMSKRQLAVLGGLVTAAGAIGSLVVTVIKVAVEL